jgi:hypothetical protein
MAGHPGGMTCGYCDIVLKEVLTKISSRTSRMSGAIILIPTQSSINIIIPDSKTGAGGGRSV